MCCDGVLTGGSRGERKHSTAPGDARTFVNPTCNSSARLVKSYSKYVCDFCFLFLFFVLFCFASLLLFLGVFLPVIYRRGVRYSRCPSLWLLPLSLFDLIAIPLSLLLHFIPLSLSLLCPPIRAVLHHLYMYMVAFLALRILYVVALVCFCFCPLFFFPLLDPSLAKMSSAGYCHARFLLSAFFSFLFFSDRVRPQFVLV